MLEWLCASGAMSRGGRVVVTDALWWSVLLSGVGVGVGKNDVDVEI